MHKKLWARSRCGDGATSCVSPLHVPLTRIRRYFGVARSHTAQPDNLCVRRGVATSPPVPRSSAAHAETSSLIYLLYDPNRPSSLGNVGTREDEPRVAIDIVLVHGLGSGPLSAWRDSKDLLWPAVYIPQDFPRCRVWSAGYDVSGTAGETAERTNNELERKTRAVDDSLSDVDGTRKEKSYEAIKQQVKSQLELFSSLFTASSTRGSNAPTTALQEEAHGIAVRDAGSGGAPFSSTAASLWQQLFPTHSEEKKQVVRESSRIRQAPSANRLLDVIRSENEDGASEKSANGEEGRRLGSCDLPCIRLFALNLLERLKRAGVGCPTLKEEHMHYILHGENSSTELPHAPRTVPIVFLCHSMGGLVVKEMITSVLEEDQETAAVGSAEGTNSSRKNSAVTAKAFDSLEERARIRDETAGILRRVNGVVFVATPHFGSPVATTVAPFQPYLFPSNASSSAAGRFASPVLRELADDNEALWSLNARFLALWRTRMQGKIKLLCFGETEKLHGVALVVPPHSANIFSDVPPPSAQGEAAKRKGEAAKQKGETDIQPASACHFLLLPNAHHHSISRPENKLEGIYPALHDFISQLVTKKQ